jgi:hypothetical protein
MARRKCRAPGGRGQIAGRGSRLFAWDVDYQPGIRCLVVTPDVVVREGL